MKEGKDSNLKTKVKMGNITMNTNEIQRIIRECFENLHWNNLENLEEIGTFPDEFNKPKLNQEDINQLIDM
jgi:hypothetical protein